MTRRTVFTALVVLIAIGLVGYAAHSFDLVGFARSLHGG
jgi:hypothetical protein